MEYAVDLGNGHSVLQDTDGYLFTQDSVVCAISCAPAAATGCWTSAAARDNVRAALLKKGVKEAVGLEIDPRAAALARKNAERCGLSEKMRVVCRDVKGAAEELGRECFDKVVCNPPYFDFPDGTDGGAAPAPNARTEPCLPILSGRGRNACVSAGISLW